MSTSEVTHMAQAPETVAPRPPAAAPGAAPAGAGTSYTVVFEGPEGERWEADLEHAAPMPRVGEAVDYIDARGRPSRWRVTAILHTLQVSAAQRPSVREGHSSPNAVIDGEPIERPPSLLRAGLPKVLLAPEGRIGPAEEGDPGASAG